VLAEYVKTKQEEEIKCVISYMTVRHRQYLLLIMWLCVLNAWNYVTYNEVSKLTVRVIWVVTACRRASGH
jgi:hypothetical protein